MPLAKHSQYNLRHLVLEQEHFIAVAGLSLSTIDFKVSARGFWIITLLICVTGLALRLMSLSKRDRSFVYKSIFLLPNDSPPRLVIYFIGLSLLR
jgi:hypothetical protein